MASVEVVETLEGSPDEVWPIVSDPELLREWLDDEVELTPEPGAALRTRGEGVTRIGVVDHVEIGRRIAFTWMPAAPAAGPATTVELELEDAGDGEHTVVRIRERLLEAAIDLDVQSGTDFRALAALLTARRAQGRAAASSGSTRCSAHLVTRRVAACSRRCRVHRPPRASSRVPCRSRGRRSRNISVCSNRPISWQAGVTGVASCITRRPPRSMRPRRGWRVRRRPGTHVWPGCGASTRGAAPPISSRRAGRIARSQRDRPPRWRRCRPAGSSTGSPASHLV